MKGILKLAISLNLIILFCFSSYSQNDSGSDLSKSDMTAEKWREDLQFLKTELIKRHPDPFHDVSRGEFESAVKILDAKIDELTPHQIIQEMAKLVASIGEGHTRVNLPRDGNWKFNRYPIRFYLYDNGLFIQEIAEKHKEIVGLKVVKIADLPTEQVLKKVSPIVHSDNEMTKKFLLPFYLNTPEVLLSLGIIKNIDDLPLTVKEKNGQEKIVHLSPTEDYNSINWHSANDEARVTLPLWQKKKDDNYWFEYLENLKTVYIQFNAVDNKRDESIAQFSERLYYFIKDNPVEKLILDIRLNGGGNSRLAMPLLHAIIKSDKINQKGKFFTIIGRVTFSAAMVFAVELENHTEAIFVGEPTGGSPNQYGEMLGFNLPNSGILVNYAAYYFQTAGPFDNREWLAPEIAAAPSMESFSKNRDPAFDAIISYKPMKPLSVQMLSAYENGGVKSAFNLYQHFKNEEKNRYVDTERELRQVGNQLERANKYDDAIAIFNLNVEAYPERVVPYISLAEVYFEKGDKVKAKELYLKAVSYLESDDSIHKGFRERLKTIVNDRLNEIR